MKWSPSRWRAQWRREAALSLSTSSQTSPRPITTVSLPSVTTRPASAPARTVILSIPGRAPSSVIEHGHNMDQRKDHQRPGEGNVQAEPNFEQVVITQLRVEQDLQLFLLEQQPDHLAKVFLLSLRDLFHDEP